MWMALQILRTALPSSTSPDPPFPVLPDVVLGFTRVIPPGHQRHLRALHNTDTITANALLYTESCCGVF